MAKAFTTNTAGQILKQTVPNAAYIYAGPPNSGTTNFTVDGLNQALSGSGVEAASYAWDANGNLATETPQGSGAIAYAYDGAGRLTARGTVTLSYDPLGRLFALTPQGGAATRFAYDYGEIIGEFSAANALLVRYVKGAGADETLVAYAGAGTSARTFLHADERGSIIARTDNTGTPLGANTYDAYGRPGASNAGRFQYTGQAWMPELGLYYYKARFYHPKLGRFIQTDPIGYAAGLNLYAYAGGDPVNFSDPSGLRGEGAEDITVTAFRKPARDPMAFRGVMSANHILNHLAEDSRTNDVRDDLDCDANPPGACETTVTGKKSKRGSRSRGALMMVLTGRFMFELNVTASCEANESAMEATNHPDFEARTFVLLLLSLSHPGGVAEYGNFFDRTQGMFGSPFTSGEQWQIKLEAMTMPDGGAMLDRFFVRQSYSSFVFIHVHPNAQPPSPLSQRDEDFATALNMHVIAVDSSRNLYCSKPSAR